MIAVLITLLLIGGSGWYGWTGYVARYKKCSRCQGLGFEPSRGLARALSSSSYRECRRCHGYGQVPRASARHVDRRRQQAGKRPNRKVYR